MSSPKFVSQQERVRSRICQIVVALAVVCLLFCPGVQGQVLKGVKPQQRSLSKSRQLYEHLRGTLSGSGRTSPTIANPNASQHDNSSIIVVCRNQKQNADREILAMQSSFRALGDGSVRKAGITDGSSKAGQKAADGCERSAGNCGVSGTPGAQPLGTAGKITNATRAISGNKTASGDSSKVGAVRSQDAVVPVVQKPGAPQGPMKTESASGNQGPGGAATVSQALPSCSPTVTSISGFPTGIFSPNELFNPYTIKGCGFGWQMGNVYLTGPFNAGKIRLNVQTTPGNQRAPGRPSWSDTAIVVTVDPQISGEVLQQNVTLVVEPTSVAPIQKPGNKFLPVYEDAQLQQIPQNAIKFSQQPAFVGGGKDQVSMGPMLASEPPDLLYFSPSQAPKGLSAEVFREGASMFFPAATDYYDFSGLAQGYWVTGFQLHQAADPTGCDAGTESSRGSWNTQWETNGNIRVTWKEFRCTYSNLDPNPFVWSDYALNVTVKGPRGIDPWTGRRPFSAIAPAAVQRVH